MDKIRNGQYNLNKVGLPQEGKQASGSATRTSRLHQALNDVFAKHKAFEDKQVSNRNEEDDSGEWASSDSVRVVPKPKYQNPAPVHNKPKYQNPAPVHNEPKSPNPAPVHTATPKTMSLEEMKALEQAYLDKNRIY